MSPVAGATAVAIQDVDCLALLALKVAPNVFDISSGQHHVSIRDQIVRGQLLVRDLCRLDPDFNRLLVIGAGAGGAATAVAAAQANLQVRLIDAAPEPFSLQRGVTQRFVAPFMYEWPSGFSDDQRYPPRDPAVWGPAHPAAPVWNDTTPVSADALASDLDGWFRDEIAGLHGGLQCWCSVNRDTVRRFVHAFVATTTSNLWIKLAGHLSPHPLPRFSADIVQWPDGTACKEEFVPDYIVLAAGMGAENTAIGEDVRGTHFWGDDDLCDAATVHRSIGIFGGGDGALQDALRALTGHRHPLETLEALRADEDARKALDVAAQSLITLEAQGRLYACWTQGRDIDATARLDEGCRRIAQTAAGDPDLKRCVLGCIRECGGGRQGIVHHVVLETHFTKAYMLNRFLIHLMNAALGPTGTRSKDRMDYRLMFGYRTAYATAKGPQPGRCEIGIESIAGPDRPILELDLAVVRFGLDRREIASGYSPKPTGLQMVQLSKNDSGQRTSLAQIPLPFALPK
ncbi:hypothetical protein ACI2IY_13850 [Lysobacter enzymogenes]|uniref:hypothetical protein n=1 Tax=Lysobacter enzymogenes TaxID=69 RepID=UPI00384F12A2